MANIRDIINAATPGPWRSESGVVRVGVGGLNAIAYTDTVGLFGKDAGENARHIAAYSPDHALLIEAFIDAFVADEEQQTTLSEVSVYTAFNALAAYRKERGLDG